MRAFEEPILIDEPTETPYPEVFIDTDGQPESKDSVSETDDSTEDPEILSFMTWRVSVLPQCDVSLCCALNTTAILASCDAATCDRLLGNGDWQYSATTNLWDPLVMYYQHRYVPMPFAVEGHCQLLMRTLSSRDALQSARDLHALLVAEHDALQTHVATRFRQLYENADDDSHIKLYTHWYVWQQPMLTVPDK